MCCRRAQGGYQIRAINWAIKMKNRKTHEKHESCARDKTKIEQNTCAEGSRRDFVLFEKENSKRMTSSFWGQLEIFGKKNGF